MLLLSQLVSSRLPLASSVLCLDLNKLEKTVSFAIISLECVDVFVAVCMFTSIHRH